MTTACQDETPVASPSWVIEQRVRVDFDYPVIFTHGVLEPHNHALVDAVRRKEPTRRHRLCCFIDTGVAAAFPGLAAALTRYVQHHTQYLQLVAAPILVPGGEPSKQDRQLVEGMRGALQEHHMDRQSCVVIIGGGAVLDAVGYAAATVHRGVRAVRIPSTVLSQNDAGVGVKNGINAYGSKNFLGTFAPPFAVINDHAFIKTLSIRDQRAGIAEAIKVALLRDPAFFAWLEANVEGLCHAEDEAMAHMIRRGAELHLLHIASHGDPFEQGTARPLDFGHWSAHRLEAMTHHELRHGEAVAIGLAIDCVYSQLTGLLDDQSTRRVLDLLHRLEFPLQHPALLLRDTHSNLALLHGLTEFQEHLGGELTLTMLKSIGHGVDIHDVDKHVMTQAIHMLANQETSHAARLAAR